MDGDRMLIIILIELLNNSQQAKGGVNRFGGMYVTIHLLKDNHKAITSSFVDIAASFMDTIEKRRKITLNQCIERLWGQPLAQTGIATNVKEEDRNVSLVLLS